MEHPPQLRPQFFGHVIGPIGHHCVAQAASDSEYYLRSNLHNELVFPKWFPRFKDTDFETPQAALKNLVDGMRGAAIFASSNVRGITKFPLTPQQQRLLKTLQKGKQNLWYKKRNGDFIVKKESSFTTEANTVLRSLFFVAKRTQGLEVRTLEDLVALAQRPELPSVLRPLMAGGDNFDMVIESDSDATVLPIFQKFCGEQIPVAILGEDGFIRTNPVVIEMARQFNRLQNGLAPLRKSDDGKIFGNAAGCPLKNLRFRQHTRLLDTYGASLTDQQIEILTGGDNPTAIATSQVGNGIDERADSFVIVRDAVSVTLQMVARQLDGLVDVFDREIANNPGNEYLLGNVGLLIGKQFDPSAIRQSAFQGRQLSRAIEI